MLYRVVTNCYHSDRIEMKKKISASSIQMILLQLLLGVVITASVLSLPLDFIEAPLYDLRVKASFKPAADERIVLITIDDQTLNQLNELNPLPLNYHQKAIEKLEEQKVKAIGYLVDFNKVKRIDAPNFENDTAMNVYRSMVRLNAHGTPVLLGVPFDVNGEVTPPSPFHKAEQSISIIHRDGTIFGKDKITRRGLISLNGHPAFEMSLADKLNHNTGILPPLGTYSSSEADAEYFLIPFHSKRTASPDNPEEEDFFTYSRYSFVDLINDKLPANELKDKIVLIGTFQQESPGDFTIVNYHRDVQQIPKLVVQANILDSILNHQGIRQIGFPLLATLTLLIALSIVFISFRVRPGKLILISAYLLFGTFALSYLLMQPIPYLGSFWLPLGAPLISLTLSFYLMIPMRLYSEHRKRFALEKENRMLIQVEEMKTNFLQLVTHDLKTPIAKIQGLTETLQRSLSDRLSSKDLETMNHIFLANQELNQFITSILELSRIDTQGVKVQLQSKDINQLLEQVMIKLRFVAQSKRIKLVSDFEPLFPIKIDVELIGKVLSNLIDNAIKYSQDEKTVTIQTREIGEYLEISIHDQGIGISKEDQQHLFARFHRIKNNETQKIKGSGLGLYLSKYFIEAHGGLISVNSEPGQGTKFTILLPMNLHESTLPQAGLTIGNIAKNSRKFSFFKKEKDHA